MTEVGKRACPVCAKTINTSDDDCGYCGHRFRGSGPSPKPRQPSLPASDSRSPTDSDALMLPQERNTNLKIIGSVAASAAALILVVSFIGSNGKGSTGGIPLAATGPKPQEIDPTDAELSSLIEKDAISTYSRQDRRSYPKLFAALGDRVLEVGELGMKAALLSLRTGRCDKVVYVDVSEISTRQNLQFFVDCQDETRIRVTENEIRSGLATNIETKDDRVRQATEQVRQYDKHIADAKEEVLKELRDPESAEFGPMAVSTKGGVVVCGTVNARNGFGGMSGQQPFVAFGNGVSMPTDSDFEQVWKKHCEM